MHIIKQGPHIYNAIDKSSTHLHCLNERKLVQNNQVLQIKINILCQVVVCAAPDVCNLLDNACLAPVVWFQR